MYGSFRIDLNRVRDKIGESVKVKAERITQTIYDGVVRRSPVFTGNYRASWNVSEGLPVYKVVDSGSEGSPLSAPTFTVKAKTQFPHFFVTNGQPYAKKLEEGWSKTQAPHGVVRVTIASLR